MTIRRILTEPDPVLRQKSQPVDKVDDSVRKLMDDMVETMYDAPGIGLAAIQVGIPKRIIVLDISNSSKFQIYTKKCDILMFFDVLSIFRNF